ncbi:MAG: tyrosine-protein phosphatase [Pseudomonadota bacterium]
MASVKETLHPRRHIPLASVQNLRDLGGYRTTDGMVTRWGTFLRSGGLSQATGADQQKMLEHGVRTVVDLRSVGKIVEAPNPFANRDDVRYHHHDLWGDRMSDFQSSTTSLTQEAKLADLYRTGFPACAEVIGDIMATLADAGDQGTIFHCGAGKDRTGMIAALLLGIARVPNETISADYALTEMFLDEPLRDHSNPDPMFMPGKGRKDLDPVEAALPLYFHSCLPGTMSQALDFLDREYGGVVGYVRNIGLSDLQIQRLRSKFVEEGE